MFCGGMVVMKNFNRTRFPFKAGNDNQKNKKFKNCYSLSFNTLIWDPVIYKKAFLLLFICCQFAKNFNASSLKSTNVIPGFERESKSLNVVNSFYNSFMQKKAHDAYQLGDFKKAESLYSDLLLDDKNDANLNYNVGTVLQKQKKFDDALPYLNRAIENSKNNKNLKEQALFNRANNFVQQEKLDEAIKDYKKMLEMNPKNESARTNLKFVEELKKQKKQDKNKSNDKNKDKQKQKSNDKSEQKSSDQKNDDGQGQKDKSKSEQQEKEGKKEGQDQQEQQSQEKKEDGLQKSKDAKSKSGKDEKQRKEKDADHNKSSTRSDDDKLTKSESLGKEQTKLDDAFAKEMMGKPSDDKRLEKKSAMLLEKLDDYEKNIQKKLLQINVTKQGAQKHGQKNW
jgi:tetratricopeptide (TPR) repeat protein